MQLNDILEENSIKAISQKTKISEVNLEHLLHKRFEALKKVKTMGFISILEREYHADLSAFREEAKAYYSETSEDQSVTLGLPVTEQKKGKSVFFLLIVFALFAYATWYFLTQFDKKHLKELLPFIDEATLESFVGDAKQESNVTKDVNIAKVHVAASQTPQEEKKVASPVVTLQPSKEEEPAIVKTEKSVVEESSVNEAKETESVLSQSTPEANESIEVSQEDTTVVQVPVKHTNKTIRIVPTKRLWFGMIDTTSQQRENLTISQPYRFDVTSTSWLIATSTAPFSIVSEEDTKIYTDSKVHYFKIDTEGIHPLTKQAYVEAGGYRKW